MSWSRGHRYRRNWSGASHSSCCGFRVKLDDAAQETIAARAHGPCIAAGTGFDVALGDMAMYRGAILQGRQGQMSRAFVFPGQGAQVIGMGADLAQAYPAARAVFDEVDEALGEKLSALIWEGEQDQLTLTANAQPALMATSLAAMRALEAEGVAVEAASFVAGHSLGEYSALTAAGALSVAGAGQGDAGRGAGWRWRDGRDPWPGARGCAQGCRRGGARRGLCGGQ